MANQIKLLLVGNDLAIREALTEVLSSENLNVLSSASSSEAIQAFSQTRISNASGLRRVLSAAALILLALCFDWAACAQAPLITQVAPTTGSVATGGGVVIVRWSGGTAPFQVQSCTSLTGEWLDVDGTTSANSQTNIMTAPVAFYRVASVANTMSAAKDKTPPTVPANLAASAVSCSQVNLSWSTSTDTGNNASGVKGYNVYRNGTFLTQVRAPATSTSDTSVAPLTSYAYAVSAVDNAMNSSAKCTPVTISTPACSVVVTNPGGTAPLSIVLTNPASGATLSSTTLLGASASTNTTRVEFYCDSTSMLLGTVTAAPYTANCDTTQIPNGSHNLYCKAYDALGNSTNSSSVTVTVNNTTIVPAAFNWVQTFGGSVFQDTIISKAVAVDKRDNSVVMMGEYLGTATIGGTTLPSASRGVFLAKYSSSGTMAWVKYFVGTNAQVWTGSVAVDASGNIVVAGAFTASVDFGGGPLTSSGWSLQTPNTDIFVAKFSPNGSHQWSKNFGGYQQNDSGTVTVDGSGNVLLSGYFSGTADFGGGPMTSVGYTDIFVAKLSPTGGYVWAKQYGSAGCRDSVISIAADSAGNVIIGGNFNNTLDFGVGALNSASGSQDMFIAKLSSAGTPIWARRCGGASNDSLRQVAVDGSGNVAITGSGVGTFDFNGSNPLTLAPTTSQAIFAKFDSNGGYLWSKAFNEMPLGEEGEGVTFDSAGNVLFTGYTLSDIYDFAGVRSIQDGTADVFTVKFSATGDWKWAKRLSASAGFSGTDRGYGIAVDASNNVLTTGQFGGQGTGLDFGGGNITTGSASSYGFLLKVGP